MTTVFLIIHVLLAAALIGIVLLQRSEGGGLGIGGGMSGFMTGRGSANLLTRATAALAALFFTTSLVLAILATAPAGRPSIFDKPVPAPAPVSEAPAAPAPQSGSGPAEPAVPQGQ